MQINLTKTQYKVLLRALSELENNESGDGCNDVFAGDKLRLLSKPEQKAAKKVAGNNDHEWNFTATLYLIDVLKRQGGE